METILALAELHVAEGEKRVADQKLLVKKLEHDGSEALAADAGSILKVMEEMLASMRDHLRMERAKGMI